MSSIRSAFGLAALGLLSAAWFAWAAEEKPTPAEKPAASTNTNGKSSGDERPTGKEAAAKKPATAAADPFAVPEGSPKELIAFIEKLGQKEPPDSDTMNKMRQAVLKAAEKILAAKADDEEMEFAAMVKMSLLEKPEQLVAFAAELTKSGHAKLARQVRGVLLENELRSTLMAGPEQTKKVIEKTIKFLQEVPPQQSDLSLAFLVSRLSEVTKDNPFAIRTCRSLAKIFAASRDAQAAGFVKILDGVVRRLDLVGHTMEVQGQALDGTKFDWSKYRGKVVLVDFWATWCRPCLAEIPNMEECYDLYHAKGFDIVALSLDENPAQLKEFAKSKEIPWTIVYGGGKPSPTASYYGVLVIPAMMLVGKDGKVVTLEARGGRLRKELEKLLGPAPETKADNTIKPAEGRKLALPKLGQ